MNNEIEQPRPYPVVLERVFGFTVFYSLLRIHLFLKPTPALEILQGNATPLLVTLQHGDQHIDPKVAWDWQADGWNLVVEALIDPTSLLTDSRLAVEHDGAVWQIALADLSLMADNAAGGSLTPAFKQMVQNFKPRLFRSRARMLDIGGRVRSLAERRLEYPSCDVTVIDIAADPSVDVVGDAHELSRHFKPETFDFVLCVSVFEHLLMPWKVAIEMNKVMRPGGIALIHTHQTIGMHDLPWDFYRFSDTSWHGLFNAFTGFEIVQTMMSGFVHVIPRAWTLDRRLAESSGGFEGSTVIIRKTGKTRLAWPVKMATVITSAYPLHKDGNV